MADLSPFAMFGKVLELPLTYDMFNRQSEQQEYLMNKQHQLNLETMKQSQQYGRQNALDAGLFEKFSKQRAGLNINSDGGFSPVAGASGVGTGAPSAPTMSAPDFTSFAQLLQQAPLVRSQIAVNQAQENLLKEDARGKMLHNNALENQQNVFRALSPLIEVEKDADGHEIYFSISSQEGFDAYKSFKELNAWKEETKARELIAKLHALVSSGQIANKGVIKALVSRPEKEQSQILATVAKAISDVGLNAQKIKESEQNVRLMASQEQLNRIEAQIKKHENTYLLLTEIFGEGNEGVLSAVTLALSLLAPVAQTAGAAAKLIK